MIFLDAAISALALSAVAIPACKKMQHYSYFLFRGYYKIVCSVFFAILCLLQALEFCLQIFNLGFGFYIVNILTFAVGMFFLLKKQKTKLKFTKRIWRLLIANFLLCFLLHLQKKPFVLPLLSPLFLFVAFFLVLPLELLINNFFLQKAKSKLQNANFIKIAVVGSFGKTSIKQILQQLLPNAVATPNSCNTPMGICKFVNNSNLTDAKYVIFEMGARKRGDIKELCNLVRPSCAIFSGVTLQHLETFKTFDNIVATKREILTELPREGFVILNFNNEVAKNSQSIGVCKKIVAGGEGSFEAKLLSVDKSGSTFSLKAFNETHLLRTPLLGQAHVENIALSLAAAVELGENFETLAAKIATLKQIPHRMEIKSGFVTVIDDGYNANIDGVKLCANTLQMLNGKKIAIMQGIVEGGSRQRQLNIEAGRLFLECCDVVVVCGKNAVDLKTDASEFQATVEVASDLHSAVELAQKYYTDNTFVVFQNDIP